MEPIVEKILFAFASSLFGLAYRRPIATFKIVIALLIFVSVDQILLNCETSRWQKSEVQLTESVAQSWSLLDSIQRPVASKSNRRALVKVRATITQLLQHQIEETETRLEEQKNSFMVAYLILLTLSEFCMLLMTVKNRRSSEIL